MRKIQYTIFFLFVTCMFTFSVPVEAAPLFIRDLKAGMKGPDVLQLQKILNSDLVTRISSTGAGSPGQETDFFGPKTAAAVAKFQEKYASTVLLPVGLSRGTGYVGSQTRIQLEKVLIGSTSTAIITLLRTDILSQAQAFAAVSQNDVLIFGTSHTKVRPGDSLTLTGYGFDANTTVRIGPSYSTVISATSTGSLHLIVPPLPHGQYELWVETVKGNSRRGSPTKITIADVSDKRPNILLVTPESAAHNDTITVVADKLDSNGNKIYSTLGILRSVPSIDGKTMTFRVRDLPNASLFWENQALNEMNITFGIGTSEGLSLNYGHFILRK